MKTSSQQEKKKGQIKSKHDHCCAMIAFEKKSKIGDRTFIESSEINQKVLKSTRTTMDGG